jgi:hypothetical protein
MEKWLGKPNRKPLWRGSNAYYGKPAHLFRDSDRDGVPNVFDCKPHNKRRQDVISPFQGSNPMQEMHNRQEAARQQAVFQRQQREFQRVEEEKLKELQRLSNVTEVSNVRNEYWIDNTTSGGGATYPNVSTTGVSTKDPFNFKTTPKTITELFQPKEEVTQEKKQEKKQFVPPYIGRIDNTRLAVTPPKTSFLGNIGKVIGTIAKSVAKTTLRTTIPSRK